MPPRWGCRSVWVSFLQTCRADGARFTALTHKLFPIENREDVRVIVRPDAHFGRRFDGLPARIGEQIAEVLRLPGNDNPVRRILSIFSRRGTNGQFVVMDATQLKAGGEVAEHGSEIEVTTGD